ncbi:hypothetical protein HS088_TW21G00087 [Tripterygium wilfordii]|uniref:Uncharacterized protein n=1 Tax=Tripterygium wilfordii TaxID=458696 RepID=A0A7J7C274_TRIWF|nr:uncharacterized protein LOC119989836 [Tripterygium wilfordii]KAF5727947.1 hypothetical protein HS088_TW21G00087 [Tripterygium wilfordii]
MNQKFKKSQILMLSLLAALLSITPFLSSSLRPAYLYFIFNLLIIALAVEAGFLSVLSKPLEEKRPAVSAATKPLVAGSAQEGSAEAKASVLEFSEKAGPKVMEKSSSEKVVSLSMLDKEVKKCPSMPSLFFIGGGEIEAEEVAAEEMECEGEEDEEVMVPSGQELFTKAEIFIGNFYKQLKMQREESWKKIHGFYQKAF